MLVEFLAFTVHAPGLAAVAGRPDWLGVCVGENRPAGGGVQTNRALSAMKNGLCRIYGGITGRPPSHERYTSAAVAEDNRVRLILPALPGLLV